jgi:hypothetical protein
MEEEKKPVEEPSEDLGHIPESKPHIMVRAEEILKKMDEKEKALEERETELAERMLASSAGGNVPQKQLSDNEKKKRAAIEYWKGTGIDKAIEEYEDE